MNLGLKEIFRRTTQVLLITSAFVMMAFSDLRPFVIYGDDDRLDYYQVERSDIKELADATAGLVYSHQVKLSPTDSNKLKIETSPYGSAMKLCEDEPYFDQETAPFCSGFLVGEDLLVTAGHCVLTQEECEQKKFIFGFHMNSKEDLAKEVSPSQVYGCVELIQQELTENQDYALIRLNRKVEGVKPLKISRNHFVAAGDPLFVIGHPVGLPTKIAAGAAVRGWSPNKTFFQANLDTYGGNSGSAVFNAETHEVEGILVRGETDFEYNDDYSCRRSYKCNNDECRGEDVTNIKLISNLIPETY